MSLPPVKTIRTRISKVIEPEIKKALMFQYLICGRAKEVIGRVCPNDKSGRNKATGPKGIDARIDEYLNHEIALFNVYTQKRQDRKRIIALPLEYEPWAQDLIDYFAQFGKDPVFNFTRQTLWRKSKPYFKDLTYPIEQYTIYDNQGRRSRVKPHTKNFTLHALRHLRASELIGDYGFNGFELGVYGGWKLATSVGLNPQFDRYVSLNWQSYLPKLLKARRW